MKSYINKNTNKIKSGLRKIHIGDDVWLYGKQNNVPDKGLHMVIYGPNNKEYHVWGKEVDSLRTVYGDYGKEYSRSNVDRHGNSALESKVKIHILTAILDNKDNWCFDLSKIPPNGKLKVICENGTVKNIEFNGVFYPQELVSKRYTWKAGSFSNLWPKYAFSDMKFKDVIGYRIGNIN